MLVSVLLLRKHETEAAEIWTDEQDDTMDGMK